ncbi:PREDICTED: protein indeterminate-domain 5, chloroplastic-like [Camelina sativa]|uniref:Protein indeterminate-domain 5, chloroplastic-like n=1 Tax=Camelina sativa TaxID=90675 RepID=A0ABM0ZP91_CAMSA|nr:PREDICTED: protein indeterminate-domain 5, chloroplastic-like [Camelina sativa]
MGAPQNLDHQSSDVLRLGSGGGGTASRSSSDLIAANASGYFMQEQNPSFHDQQDHHHHHHQQGFLAANNNIKPSPMSFQQNLMQFSHDNHNPASSNLFNLSFLSGNNGVTSATSNPNAPAAAAVSSGNLMMSNHYDGENAVGGGGEGSTGLFPNNLMSSADRISSGSVPSLFSSSMQNPNSTPHMSATALLQKAAQMGSVNGVDSPFGSYGGGNKGLSADKQSMTRDFLGVGQIVRSMSGSGGERVGSSSDSADRSSMNVNTGGGPASTSPPYGIHHASF